MNGEKMPLWIMRRRLLELKRQKENAFVQCLTVLKFQNPYANAQLGGSLKLMKQYWGNLLKQNVLSR